MEWCNNPRIVLGWIWHETRGSSMHVYLWLKTLLPTARSLEKVPNKLLSTVATRKNTLKVFYGMRSRSKCVMCVRLGIESWKGLGVCCLNFFHVPLGRLTLCPAFKVSQESPCFPQAIQEQECIIHNSFSETELLVNVRVV